MQEYEDVEIAEVSEKQGKAGKTLAGIFCIVYVLLIAAYAWQTWELVNWLFPDDNWPMKIMGVFVCDGCAILYAAGETFYKFKMRRTFDLVGIMWAVTFIMSTAASAINLYISSSHRVPHVIDPNILSSAYIINIVAFIANIVALTFVFKIEYSAGKPQRVYLDDGKPRKKLLPSFPKRQEHPAQPQSSTPVQQSVTQAKDADYAAFQAWKQQQEQARPLAMPELKAEASQNGNGH